MDDDDGDGASLQVGRLLTRREQHDSIDINHSPYTVIARG